MNAVPAGVVCAMVLLLALGMFALLSHVAMRFIDRYEARSTIASPRRVDRSPR